MTAAEATKMAVKANHEDLAPILKQIQLAAHRGEFHLEWALIGNETASALRSFGYTVRHWRFISWEPRRTQNVLQVYTQTGDD